MNYKKIIKNKETRIKILQALSFVPDKLMLQTEYFIKNNRLPNLKNPQRFTEKLIWYKLNYRDPLMKKCVDKYDVREYIESLGYGDLLVNCYGVFDNVEDINFEVLPDKFVLKDTVGSGGHEVIVCKDKSKLDIEETKKQLNKWLAENKNINKKNIGREWVYDKIRHRIIIDEYIEAEKETGITDYKFICFNGEFGLLYVVNDRKLDEGADFAFYDENFNKLDVTRSDEKPSKIDEKRPENFERLLEVAKNISKGFPECRVDLYDENNVIKFGEITFFDGGGYFSYNPDSFDFELGSKFKLPEKNK